MIVSLNGVVQQENRDYTISPNNSLVFKFDLTTGSTVTVQSGSYVTYYKTGAGQTIFPADNITLEESNFARLMSKTVKHKDHPMVKDALERLNVAVALIE